MNNLDNPKPQQTDLQTFVDKFQPAKFKQLKSSIEIRGVYDLHAEIAKAQAMIKKLKLNLTVLSTGEMAAYKAYEVREVGS